MSASPRDARLDLFWLPLGAGGRFVRANGRVYEWVSARREHRVPLDLYHCGLVLALDDTTYAIEMGPVWNLPAGARGVVCEGPVGARCLGRFRAFRYEVRCWPGGRIPDIDEAVGSPVRVTDDATRVADVLRVLPDVPALTWGRDELGAGEMWNSNSVMSWVLARTGCDLRPIRPPRGGRAPGWGAGLVLAGRTTLTGLPSGSPPGSRRAAGRARSGRSTRR